MDMSFKEKSAWGLLLGILAVSVFYFPAAIAAVELSGSPWSLVRLSIGGVVALIVIEAVYHGIVVGGLRQDADGDERDELIDLKAERIASFSIGFSVIWIVGRIIATSGIEELDTPNVLMVAVWLLAALTLSEIVKLVSLIWHYRTGV
jgi:hypothetical protein